jgi:hypothetical protein
MVTGCNACPSSLSIRAGALLVEYVASITTLYKIGVWAIRTYHP